MGKNFRIDQWFWRLMLMSKGRRYVGYARVNTNDGTSINYSVEETNESVIQYLICACNSVRLGDFDKNVIDKYCDFGVKK